MLKIKNLNKTFYLGMPEENRIFENFSVEAEKNKCTAILGANGCGKSTLFNIISGSVKSDSGTIRLNDLELEKMSEQKRALHIGKVNQDPSKGVSPSLSILENMSIALKKGDRLSFKRLLKNTDIDLIVKKLRELDLGLEDKLNTQVRYLSGGQRQSLSLLMATIKKPDLLLLDEHTAALDPKTSKIVMDKTADLIYREKITTLMITHNLNHAIKYSSRIIMLNKGKIVLDIKSSEITEEQLNRLYNENIERELKTTV
ncbi:ABC transporter ATP-binding protein [Peptoniphilus mikwangii]|uniref:ABC transporter ATP-binding protein n=1 Tax=Peptoniphilus mikwangii TaxID=1354300 RepID=UPI0004157FFD|nr:ATP-binding cassette domain-containing protein [Peptoniphilus mikwangii]